MKKEEIYLWDIKRILLGEAPPAFLLETLVRTIIIFIIFLMIVRLLGKRMSGQLTITELAVMLTLGAIVSPAMQAPDRGLLAGIILLLCILGFQRGLNWWAFKQNKIEKLTQGDLSILVVDGVMQLDTLKATNISRQQLFAGLRNQKIFNLGKVERVYLEACGLLTVYQYPEPNPGLPILPPNDNNLLKEQKLANNIIACCSCGLAQPAENENGSCSYCGNNEWTNAIL